MFTNKTSLIIPTRNRVLMLNKTLKNLESLKIKFYEIIIIDSSEKKFKNNIKSISKKFKTKLYHSKPSSSYQRNIGLKNKNKNVEYVMFLDDDIIFEKKSFMNMNEKIKQYEKKNNKILGYGFNLKQKNKKNFLEKIKKSKLSEILCLYSKKPGIVMSSGWQTKILNFKYDTFTEWIPTGAVVFPSKNLDVKFNENFGRYSYLEDLDFSLNLRKNNLLGKFLVVANANFFHPNNIERIHYNFGVIEIINRFSIVQKYNLSFLHFFYMAFIKSFMTLIMSLKNIKNIIRFLGNLWGIILSFKKFIFFKFK